MTKEQIKWAEQHDWFIKSHNNLVVCRDEYEVNETIVFSNFKQLKSWAGY